MRAWITRTFDVDTNPLGRRVVLNFEVDLDTRFRFEFDAEGLRWRITRESIVKQLSEDFEEWMLGLPGDITEIEKNWRGLVSKAVSDLLDQERNFKQYIRTEKVRKVDLTEEDFDPLEILRSGSEEEKEKLKDLMQRMAHP